MSCAVLKRTSMLNWNLSLQIIAPTSSSGHSVIGCFLPKCTLGIGVHSYLEGLTFTGLYHRTRRLLMLIICSDDSTRRVSCWSKRSSSESHNLSMAEMNGTLFPEPPRIASHNFLTTLLLAHMLLLNLCLMSHKWIWLSIQDVIYDKKRRAICTDIFSVIGCNQVLILTF